MLDICTHTRTLNENHDDRKNLDVVQVDDGSSDVGQQVDEVFLVFTHQVRDLIEDYLDPLVVPEDVDVYVSGGAVSG